MFLDGFFADKQLACYLFVAASAGDPFHYLLFSLREPGACLGDQYCHATFSKIKFNSICVHHHYLFMGIFNMIDSMLYLLFQKESVDGEWKRNFSPVLKSHYE